MDKRLWEHSGRANRKFIEEMTFELGCEGHRNIFQVGMRERGHSRKKDSQNKETTAELCIHMWWGGVCLCVHLDEHWEMRRSWLELVLRRRAGSLRNFPKLNLVLGLICKSSV